MPNYDKSWGPLKYAYDTDSGFDTRACVDADVVLKPLERIRIPLGFGMQLEPGFGYQLRSRSGIGAKGIILMSGVGTIDNGYVGEVSMSVINMSGEDFKIERGMRVGQVVIEPVWQAEFTEIESADEFDKTDRGDGGHGSTGV